MQKKMTIIGIILIFISMRISSALTAQYGNNARVIFASVALSVSLLALIFIIYKKKYLEAVAVLFMILPGFVIFIGIYTNNIYVTACGLLLIFIIIPIIIKVFPKYLKKDRYF